MLLKKARKKQLKLKIKIMSEEKKSSGLLGTIGGAIVNTGMGLLLGRNNDNRAVDVHRREQEINLENNKALTEFNYGLQKRMWHETNYPAQVEEMKKAGLSVGLMYGKGGGGGVTNSVATSGMAGGVGATSDGMGLLNIAMQKAQIDNMNADTELKRAEANNQSGGVKNKLESENLQIQQNIKNLKSVEDLNKIVVGIEELNKKYIGETNENRIAQSTVSLQMAMELKESATRNNFINNRTVQDQINKIMNESVGSKLSNDLTLINTELQKENIKLTKEKTREIGESILQKWKQLNLNEKAQIIDWSNANSNAMNAATNKSNASTNYNNSVEAGRKNDIEKGKLELDKMVRDVSESTKITVEAATRIVTSLIGVAKINL